MFVVESAQGALLKLKTGETLIDGMSSWWSTLHGYRHPALDKAVKDQLDRMAHVMFGSLTHEPAVKLAHRLTQICPQGLNHVFFSDSGSVAVEVAMKMAVQYWIAKGEKRHTFLSLSRGYHGDTIAAMSVCDPITGMHHLFKGFIFEQLFADAPKCRFEQAWDESDFDDFRTKILNHQSDIAAVILEPIVQGTGGMRFYSPHYLKRVRELCDELGILLIADEIATGLGRTGKLFACEHAAISPDIMCLGKTLSAGYITLAATLCNSDIAQTIASAEPGIFMHGPTFMANPLACSVALASIDLLLSEDWQQNIQRIESALTQALNPAKELDNVADVRVLGSLGVIEMKRDVNLNSVQPMLVEKGIWLRPFGKLLYTIPPYVITDEQIRHLGEGMLAVCKAM
jgi:adenosylmethionine-8-amino-7-oxononanoate aminotransferase